MVHLAVPTSVHFHSAHGFYTQTLAQMLDSLVRVSRRVAYCHYASVRVERGPQSRVAALTRGYNTPPRGSYIPRAFIRPPELTLAWPRKSTPPKRTAEQPRPSLAA